MQSTPSKLQNKAVVVDVGSGFCKAGFAGNEKPDFVFPSIIGRPKKKNVEINFKPGHNYMIGEEALNNKNVLTLNYPVEHGIVTNWEDMQNIWDYLFEQVLEIDPSEQPIMLTEAPLNPRTNREKMGEIMFERYDVPGMYIAIQAFLSLYGSGRTTGIVLDSGDGVTHAIPIFEGYSIPHAVMRINFAGRDVTEYLMELLAKKGYKLSTSSHREVVREIKEKHCYVAMDFDFEMFEAEQKDQQTEYTLPDGRKISLSTERFLCPEILFKPSLIGSEECGIDHLVKESIMKCDIDVRRSLCDNIILSGGTTMLKGLKERLHVELSYLLPGTKGVKIDAPETRKYSVWIGASALASLRSFLEMWVSKEEYKEYGPSILHKRCTC